MKFKAGDKVKYTGMDCDCSCGLTSGSVYTILNDVKDLDSTALVKELHPIQNKIYCDYLELYTENKIDVDIQNLDSDYDKYKVTLPPGYKINKTSSGPSISVTRNSGGSQMSDPSGYYWPTPFGDAYIGVDPDYQNSGPSLKEPEKPKNECECGQSAVSETWGNDSNSHSNWCPVYKKGKK